MDNIQGYTLVNPEKFDRALNGVKQSDDSYKGGVGNGAYLEEGEWKRDGEDLTDDEVVELESTLLSEYDRLGGLIKKGDDKVKTGSFWNFKGRKAHEKPKIFFVYSMNGRIVEIPEGTELPGEVRAARFLEQAQQEAKEKGEGKLAARVASRKNKRKDGKTAPKKLAKGAEGEEESLVSGNEKVD